MVYVSHLCDPYFMQNIILYSAKCKRGVNIMYSRVIAQPSVRYSGQVETDVFELRHGWGERRCEL